MTEPAARARLVETLGLVRHGIATRPLVAIAVDAREHEDVRIAAVAALGQRSGTEGLSAPLEELVGGEGRLADVSRLAQLGQDEPAVLDEDPT